MVRIRLRRVGAKKQPHYRVVVADQRSPRDGRHIETIGYYNPRTEPETVEIKEERALYWLGQGAQPSEVVRHMLEKQGTLGRLARLKAGEPFEALVAEYEAELPEPTDVTEPEEAVAEVEAEEDAVEEEPEAEAESEMPPPEAAVDTETATPEAQEEEPEAEAETETEEEPAAEE